MTYETEILGPEDDDGTMVGNVEALREAVVGHRIVSVERNVEIRPEPEPGKFWYGGNTGTAITLDNGRRVGLIGQDDCCGATFTELNSFLLHADKIDHVITGVGTTGGYTTWHIYADMGDVLELSVGWSCGNPFYYAFGFELVVQDVEP